MKLIQSTNFLFAGSFLCLILAGCGSSPDSVMGEMVSKMEELVEVLDKVQDKESAEKHKDEIESIAQDLNDLEEEWEKLEKDLTAEEQKELEKKYEDRVMKAAFALLGHGFRIGLSPYGQEIMEVLDTVEVKE